MSLHERYISETEKWDNIAGVQAEKLEVFAPDYDFHQFARSDSEFPGVSEFLGDIQGKKILELGCGVGYVSVLLAKNGADVTSFDISPRSMSVVKKRAELNQVRLKPLVSSGEALPFKDESFDIIFGKSILHHLIIDVARRDLNRVLCKGGKAVFVEPMGMNPLLTFARRHLPYPHKNEVGVDQPLTYNDIKLWMEGFQLTRINEIQLLSMIERVFGWDTQLPLFREMDSFLLKNIPFLRKFCRYVVILSVK